MNKDNNLSQSLHAALLDSHNSCALINHVKKLNRTELLCDILGYMSWLDELNVHSVVVMSQPSIEALSLCYAIIFSNRVYIPVHRSTGSELIQTYLQEYQVDLLVIQPSLANQLDYSFNSELLVTQDKLFHYKRVEKHPKTMCILPGIIFFTSGSTGSPKAVYYDYNTLNDYLSWCVREFKLTPTDHLLFTTELSFIASLRPLFLPILSRTNVVFIESQGANKLALIINVLSKITMLNITPTFLSIIVQYCEKNKCLASLASIRLILLSGEPINCSLVNYWMIQINPETVFYNLYGATEYLVPFYKKITGIIAEDEQLHLGQLREGCQFRLTNESQLCIAGAIARSYFDAQLNVDNYIFIKQQRFIKTNDFVSVDGNNIYYHARSQRLIKRYTQLINMDHIEYALKQEENMPVCIALADDRQENRIYLVIQSAENKELLAQIKHYLKIKLPSYMWPNEYLFSPEIPLTLSGKVDYLRLKSKLIQPKSHDIFSYFQQFFYEEMIDRDTKVINLGLESIDYIEMTEAFYKITGKWLNASKITDKIRISNIESCLEDLPTEAIKHDEGVKLNSMQQAVYWKELKSNGHNKIKSEQSLIFCYQLIDMIDVPKLIEAIKDTLNNHFLLTSRLVVRGNDYFFVQSPHQQQNFILKVPFFFITRMLNKLAISVHDDRLINIYVQKRKKNYFLIISYHHILLDGWSTCLLREEIFRRYAGHINIPNCLLPVEVDALNKANQIKLSQSSTDELKKLISKVEYSKYHHIEALFNGRLESDYSCIRIKKEKIEQLATAHQLSDMPYGVLFAWLLHQMIAQEAKINKIMFFMSLSNRNLPIPNIQELLTNLAIGLPIFLDNTGCSTREFTTQIREILSVYFKNMGYGGIGKIWREELIDHAAFLRRQKYPIVFTYISNILKNEYIQNNYIEWPSSFSYRPFQKRCGLSFRVYNMGEHFIIQLSSRINKGVHKQFVDYLTSNLMLVE